MKPNLFEISTKELTQDAFIVWLLQWADKSNEQENNDLNTCAKNFVSALIQKVFPNFSDKIESVKAGRQLKHIDIWATVNEEYFIIIEDKTETSHHGNQLLRYKEWTEKNKKNYKLVMIYFKTGNESLSRLSAIEKKYKYKIFLRKDILEILEKYHMQNDIYFDYLSHLRRIEKETNDFNSKKGLATKLGSQGFYLFLQTQIKKYTDWAEVSTPSGAFMGFFYYWTKYKKDGQELSLQIENYFSKGLKVVVKIGGPKWERKIDFLYATLKNLQAAGKENGIVFRKPSRYKIGNTTTVAEVKTNLFDESGVFDQNRFLALMNSLEKIIEIVGKNAENNNSVKT